MQLRFIKVTWAKVIRLKINVSDWLIQFDSLNESLLRIGIIKKVLILLVLLV
jgi:hypothetical protein